MESFKKVNKIVPYSYSRNEPINSYKTRRENLKFDLVHPVESVYFT